MDWATTLKEPRSADREAGVPTLRVVYTPGGDETGRSITLGIPGELPVGRAADGQGLSLGDDPRASRLHALLEVGADRAVHVTDKSSTGTRIGGRAITRAKLNDGDVVRMGDSFFVFRTAALSTEARSNHGLVGEAPTMHALRRALDLIGPTQSTVLILGETGTGKELTAQALHEASGRKGPLIAVNCSAIPESLAESQLFGHVAGSYTGATGSNAGFFRAADGGTLFLDEVGELPQALQPKLLRALEERAVIPVGQTTPVPIDIRVVAATNRDLLADTTNGEFRGDLYARLAELTVELPPLRDRPEDILSILMYAAGDPPPRLEADLVGALLVYDWPFNVRELIKVASRLKIMSAPDESWKCAALPPEMLRRLDQLCSSADAPVDFAEDVGEDTVLGDVGPGSVPDRDELEALLQRHRGVIADLARETGRSRKQVYRWLAKHGLSASNYRDELLG